MTGGQIDSVSVQLLAVALGVAAVWAFWRWPKLAVLGWLVVIGFVPVWVGANAIFYWMPAVAVGVLVAVVVVRRRSIELGVGDALVAAFLGACLVPIIVPGGWTLTSIFTIVTQWGLAYLIGRFAPGRVPLEWIYTCVGAVFVVVAGLAIIEFALEWNPFIHLPGNAGLHSVWGDLQVRGSVVRAEGAWGHSIAMGCAVGLAIPFWLAARVPVAARVVGLAVMLGGVAVSFSRAAIITAVVATVLCLWALRRELAPAVRLWVGAALALLAVALYPLVSQAYVTGQETVERSASYRGDLLALAGDIRIIGLAENTYRAPSGETYFQGYQSIDNALLLLGLTYGLIPLLLGAVLLVSAVVLVVIRRAEPPTVAIAAAVATVVSVAPITQLGMYLWFLGGLSVAAQVVRKRSADGPDGDGAAGTRPATADAVVAA